MTIGGQPLDGALCVSIEGARSWGGLEDEAALLDLAADIDVERTLLTEEITQYDRLVSKRDLADNRVKEILRSLDTAVHGGGGRGTGTATQGAP